MTSEHSSSVTMSDRPAASHYHRFVLTHIISLCWRNPALDKGAVLMQCCS